MPSHQTREAFEGLTVLERGWLSSNNILLHGGGGGATLIDSSHCLHAEQTLALVDHALGDEPLQRLINTHLHSDHCGGNAALQQRWACRVTVPAAHLQAALHWNEAELSFLATGQQCQRFVPDDGVQAGDVIEVGQRRWQVLASPGHDPHSVLLFDPEHGVLISADALWENGFGVVFPELDGQRAFDDVAQTLDLIDSLSAQWCIPGHGAAFSDLPGALKRARQRLAAFVADPKRHARHGARLLVKYHLMEVQHESLDAFVTWFGRSPLCHSTWLCLDRPQGSLSDFGLHIAQELVGSGALRLADGFLLDQA
jgi:glyoxylase-like metal-dependent hydrolase (beta-lactamase superfamily II)